MKLSTAEAFKHIKNNSEIIELKGQLLKDYQRVLAMMLADINSICAANGIEYTLGGGTCLGAVRHHGFIPWDDDIDINMTREGYRKFATIVRKDYQEKYWLHDCESTAGYELAFPRLRLKGTVVKSREDFDNKEDGAYVDIFLIDNAPNNFALRKIHGFVSLAFGLFYSCRRFAAHAEDYLALADKGSQPYKIFRRKILIGKLLSFRSPSAWTRTWDRWNGRVAEVTSYVTVACGRNHYFGELHPRSDYFPVKECLFEGMSLPVPGSVDSYMRGLYGVDYMTPPSKENQETHVVLEFDLGDYAAYASKKEVCCEAE